MRLIKHLNTLRSWDRPRWQSAGLMLLTGLFVASLIPALQSPHSLALAPALVHSPAFSRKALDLGAFRWQSITVEKGQTVSEIFEHMGLSGKTLQQVMASTAARDSFRRIRDGDILEFEINGYDQLRAMRFDRTDLEQVNLTLENGLVREQITVRPLENRLMVASGDITSSLYADAKRAGLDGNVVNQIANVFKYDIDFVDDLRDGDRFQVVYEQSFLEGKPYRQGHIRAASFINRGKEYTAFRYNHNGREEYFDANGRPLKKVLMRIPIEFARLSSTFGMRKHPVLGRMRAHKGVDYAARTGTPIMAAGDGRIEFAGWKSGYGKTIIINHGQGRTTLYGHMSAFGKYKRGQSVAQGSIIGRVGSTGLATGPHLHYEFRVGGKQVNPLKVTMPKPEPLRGAALAAFRRDTAPVVAMMEQSTTTEMR
ncbi:peptidoglycan DD-metalloendopeptidase family protein [Arenimonas sp.]|uniref:M23 family metallopeptidase n=1 Tax=Arenimonas sp. TaxID=1872635 RepID=UPI0037C17C8F